MEQLIAHLLGDYVFQSSWMALNKTKRWYPAICHAFVYSFLFIFLAPSPVAWMTILLTHLLIDRFYLGRYVVWAKNMIFCFEDEYKHSYPLADSPTGNPPGTPDYLACWLTIIADNTLHLSINWFAIRFL